MRNILRKEKLVRKFFEISELGTKAVLKKKYRSIDLFTFIGIKGINKKQVIQICIEEVSYYYFKTKKL